MSRRYEAVYIFDSTLEEAAINERLGRIHGLLGTAEINSNHWGRRQLAYPIGRRETGYYVVSTFEAEPTTLPEYERALRLDESVVRYLISLYEHEVGAPPNAEGDEGGSRRSDDDDEED